MNKTRALVVALVIVVFVVVVVRQLPTYNFEAATQASQDVTIEAETEIATATTQAHATGSVAASTAPAAAATTIEQTFATVAACYNDPDACNYPDDDPYMQSYVAGQAYKEALLSAQDWFVAQQLSQQEASRYAIEALTIPDGHVQFAALQLMQLLEPDPQFIFPILDLVADTHDAKVTALAMTVLAEQPIYGYEPQIDETLSSAMKQGAPFVAQQVAESILPFLSDNNIDHYVDLLLELPVETSTHRMLDVMVEEFALMQMGG